MFRTAVLAALIAFPAAPFPAGAVCATAGAAKANKADAVMRRIMMEPPG